MGVNKERKRKINEEGKRKRGIQKFGMRENEERQRERKIDRIKQGVREGGRGRERERKKKYKKQETEIQ